MAEGTASLAIIRKFLARMDQLRRKYAADECWPWSRTAVLNNKYGRIWLGSRPAGNLEWFDAHRLAHELFVGAIPAGRYVLHSCDNPPCVNPAHLHLGSQRDNVAEMYQRGRANDRGLRGSENGSARLTEADVVQMREAFASGDVTYGQLALRYGVTPERVGQIVRRKAWRHI